MNKNELLNIIKQSLSDLYKNDYFLIEKKNSERNIISKWHCYLNQFIEFKEFNIDPEYNKEGENGDSKRDCNNRATTADLLIHTRGNIINGNLLYLEAKMYFNITKDGKKRDIEVIKYFKDKFNYEYGMFICFNKENIEYELFYDGKSEESKFEFKV